MMQGKEATTRPRKQLDRHAASRELHSEIIRFFEDATAWADEGRDEDSPPSVVIAGSAGLGKTVAVLQALAKSEWKGRRVGYFVPDLGLAEEIAEKARAYGIDATVIRGRGQNDTNGVPMCRKADLAGMVSAMHMSVSETLCHRKSKDTNGEPVEEFCEHYHRCPYVAQLQAKSRPGLFIMAHQYLSRPIDVAKSENLDAIVIDERFWPALLPNEPGRVSIERFRTDRMPIYKPKKGESAEQRKFREAGDAADLMTLAGTVVKAAEAGRLTIPELKAAGLTPEKARFAAGVEYGRVQGIEIRPGMTAEEQRAALDAAEVSEAFRFARLWKVLEAELATDRERFHGIEYAAGRRNPRTGEPENVFVLNTSQEVRVSGVPTLILDADADEQITRRFLFPATMDEGIRAGRESRFRFVKIEAEWSPAVQVEQITDRPVSMAMLGRKAELCRDAEKARRENRVEDLALIAADVADRVEGRPLLITYKHVEEKWADEGKAVAADVAHFGAIRGVDAWKDVPALIVAGRPEPSPQAIEAQTRAIFYADPRPLAFLPAGEAYPKEARTIEAANGQREAVEVSTHPDPLCRAVLRQVRECELSQALARVRPIHRHASAPCRVLLLTNVPVDGVPVHGLTTWADRVPDRFRQMELAGFVPVQAADVAAAYPALFASAAVVRKARSRAAEAAAALQSGSSETCDIPQIRSSIWDMSHLSSSVPNGWLRVEFRVSGKKGSRAGGAFIKASVGVSDNEVRRRVLAALPDAFDVLVIRPEPTEAEAETRRRIGIWLAEFNAMDDEADPYDADGSAIFADLWDDSPPLPPPS